jgi:hypothetical protein
VGLDIVLGIQTQATELLEQVIQGLRGELNQSRYGLPFAGDNNFLFDRIDVSRCTVTSILVCPNAAGRSTAARLL